MARNKEITKEPNSEKTEPTCANNGPAGQLNESVNNSITDEPHQCHHENGTSSDSEILELSGKTAKMNRSSLYLIKSYSFIDRSNRRRPPNANVESDPMSPDLTDMANMESLLLDQKPMGKKSNAKKSKKSTSMDECTDDLNDFKHLLRQPAPAHDLHVNFKSQKTRPKSMPSSETCIRESSKNSDHNEGAAIKRDSFIRHSLQTIRRSLNLNKKSNGLATSMSSSSSSSSSASSATSSLSPEKCKKKTSKSKKTDCPGKHLKTLPSNHNVSESEVETKGRHALKVKVDVPALELKCDNRSSCGKGLAALKEEDALPDECDGDMSDQRSTSSVSTLIQLNNDRLMAPLQSCAEGRSLTAFNTYTKQHSIDDFQNSSALQQQKQPKHFLNKQLSVQSDYYSGHSSAVNESFQSLNTLGNSIKQQDNRSLRHSSTSGGLLNPLVPVASTGSIRSLSPSRKSINSSISNTAKHEQQSSAAANVAAATPPSEKEKKRKEVSSSRVKKFHRHFTQVSKDEKLINYFSCALVSDILLQGHLYITEQHFAFYSNVFGYVTKVVIPTSSVTKISKEKTVKIIPNAVGVATADERHVFGSFISREAAYRLMCSVCPPLVPAEPIVKPPTDIEISEYSIEDDSSCSISGNESPPQIVNGAATSSNNLADQCSEPMLRRTVLSSSLNAACAKETYNDKFRHSDIPIHAKPSRSSSPNYLSAVRSSLSDNAHLNNTLAGGSTILNNPTNGASSEVTHPTTGSASTSTSGSTTPSTTSLPTTVMAKPKSAVRSAAESIKSLSRNTLTHLKFPSDLHIVYLGVLLSVVLALFSVFLLYRILDIEAKTSQYHSSVDFNWGSASDDDIFAEALRWQRELQSKSSEEAQNILNTNLQQIAKVRRSLETLSMLIHDRSSAYAATDRDDRD